MSTFSMAVRLVGDLELLEKAVGEMEGLPVRLLRKGECYHTHSVHPTNVLVLELAEWERGPIYSRADEDAIKKEERAQLADAKATLQRLAPLLAGLDRSRVSAQVYISTIRHEFGGGLDLPAHLVAAAAVAGLSIGISIATAWDIGDENDGDQDDGAGS